MTKGVLVMCILSACAQEVEHSLPAATVYDASSTAPASVTAAKSSSAVADAALPPNMQRLHHELSRSGRNLRVERRDGRLHVDMAGTFQTATLVVPDADGQPRRVCLDDPAELERMLGGAQ